MVNNNNNYGNRVMDRFIENRWTINNATVDTRKCFTINSTPDAPTPRSKWPYIYKVFPTSIFFSFFLHLSARLHMNRFIIIYRIPYIRTTQLYMVEKHTHTKKKKLSRKSVNP